MAFMLKFHACILASIGLRLTEALFRPPFVPPSSNDLNRIENDREEIQYLPNSGDPMNLSDSWYSDSFEEIDEDLFSPPDKKSQTLCRVRKIQKSHYEDGYEFHPKQYNEYECVPYEGDLTEGSVHNLDICLVNGSSCKTLEKKVVFGKQLSDSQCLITHEKVVKVGCNCIHHVKFQFA